MLLDVAADTHIGHKKRKNEDSYGVFGEDTPGLRLFKQGALLVVADGLGGHIGGEIASKLGVSVIKDALKTEPPPEEDMGSEREDAHYERILNEATDRANDSIYRTNQDLVKGNRPMGTTICAALIRPKTVYLVNVGDSRSYLFRDNKIIRQTTDHSWVEEQVSQQRMTQAEAENDKRRNLLTRSVGTHPKIEKDHYQWHVEPGDQLLLCSDGLVNMVKEEQINDILAQPALAREKVAQLITLANKQGGKDNTTVIVANINPNQRQLHQWRRRAWLHKNKTVIKQTSALLLAGMIGYALGCASGYLMAR